MVTTPLDMKYVFKRERFLEKKKAIDESYTIPNLDNVNKIQYENNVKIFFNECNSYKDAIGVLETLYSDNRFDLLESCVQKTINQIIPSIERGNYNECISCIQNSNIGDINIFKLTETAKNYKNIDRIRENHTHITKRFGMDSLNGKSDRDKCFRICEMVCTYDQPVNIRFNIALEEMKYIDFIEGYKIPDKDIVKNITEYFLMSESNVDFNIYKNAIEKSRVLSNNAADSIPYIMNSSNKSYTIWEESLNKWLLDSNKNIDGIINIIKENYSDINIINKLIDYLNEYVKINDIDLDPSIIIDNIGSINENEAKNITSFIKENNISNADDILSNLRAIWEAEVNDSQYPTDFDNYEVFSSKDKDKIRMNNLITDSQSVGEFLDHLEKTSMKESPIDIKKILTNHNDEINESNIINHIDPNGFLTLKVRSYHVEGCIEDIKDLLEQSINCINNALYNSNNRSYYIVNENGFDIYLRSNYIINLTPDEESYRGFSESDIETICNIKHSVSTLNEIYNSNIFKSIINKINEDMDWISTVTPIEVKIMCEALNPIIGKDSEIIDKFVESCDYEANPYFNKIKNICYNIENENFDSYTWDNDRLVFCAEMMGINESDEIKDNDKPEEKSTNKNKGIKSLNDLKLTWQGLKSKMKKASAKEQEISRDMDIEFNHLIKTIENSGKDHREEIITGEVNHSLSRALKMGIALAGIGLAAGSVTLPIIGAVALFAKSKYTSNKEKKMIIDEIDIELQVLEREINRAEQSGSTKKYRQLLTIQKNLQRKRQEIYYGLAKKGKRIPMQSTTGLRGRE